MFKAALVVLGVLAGVAHAQPATPSIKVERVLVLGPLAEKRVTDIVEASRPALLACFDRVLAADPTFDARTVVVVVVLDPAGATTRHDVIILHAGLKACATTESAKWRFPKATDGGTLEIEVHLSFDSGRPPAPAPAPAPAKPAAPASDPRGTGGAVVGTGSFGPLAQHSVPRIVGALDSDQITVGLTRTEQTVSRCYNKLLGHDPWGNDVGALKLTISGKGKVTNTLGVRLEAPVERCLKKAFKLVKYPASKNGKPVTLIYPVAPSDAGYEQIDTTARK